MRQTCVALLLFLGMNADACTQRESILKPYLTAMSTFRDKVRKLAMEGAPASEILALSDQLRDIDLVELGVALDDQDGQSPAPPPSETAR